MTTMSAQVARAVLLVASALGMMAGCCAARPSSPRFSNPPGLSTPRGYSHVADVPAGSRLLFIAGQVPLDSAGTLVGAGDFRAQATRVFENLRRALDASGATFADVVKLNIYVIDMSQVPALREIRDRFVNTKAPPASTLVEVRHLFREDVMLEVEAVAVVLRR